MSTSSHLLAHRFAGNTDVKRSLTLAQYLRSGHVATVLGKGRVPTIDQRTLEAQGLHRRIEVRVPAFNRVPACIVDTKRIGTLQTHVAKRLAQQWPLRCCAVPSRPASSL